jgi:hypothetical protein
MARSLTQVTECLPSKCEVLNLKASITKTEISDSASPHLGVYSKEFKEVNPRDICIYIHKPAFFSIS